jgi:hypothetical protein
MLKKASILLSVFAAFGLAIAAPASAKEHGNKGSHTSTHVRTSVHVRTSSHGTMHVHTNRAVHGNVHGNYVVGRTYNGHVWYGHRRHFWHGHWYAYGVGPCWIFVDGLWFWNVAACPL